MNVFSAGDFKVKIYTDGWPISVCIYYQDQEVIRTTHHEISDLEYLITRSKSYCRGALPDRSKHEI